MPKLTPAQKAFNRTGEGQKTMFYAAQGFAYQRQVVAHTPGKDHGADPLGDGTFRMVPSGDIVSFEERNRRLAR